MFHGNYIGVKILQLTFCKNMYAKSSENYGATPLACLIFAMIYVMFRVNFIPSVTANFCKKNYSVENVLLHPFFNQLNLIIQSLVINNGLICKEFP